MSVPFLTADWRNLVMLNYEVEPSILARHVPTGCELDSFRGRMFVSVVGFQFLRTRVSGIPFGTAQLANAPPRSRRKS